MRFWNRLFGREEKSTTTTDKPAQWLIDWVRGGESTLSGVSVSPDSAMRTSAVWACVRVRSEDVGKLPCFLYRRLPDGGKERAVKHRLYSLVRDRPNPRMTAFEFRELMQTHVDLRGNAYALKEFDNRGGVVALWPIDPTKVTVLVSADGRDLFYRINIVGEQFRDPLPAEAIFHLRGKSLDGMVGISPIAYHRETIGFAIAAQKYGAAFFGNSARPDGILTVPTIVSPEAGDVLRTQWEQKFKGVENARKLAIFDGGMKWEQVGMDHTDAQYLETRNFQNRDIWRIYRMPAHKVGDLEKSTNNNIEHQALEYVIDCLMTELTRWEQTLKLSLLSEKEIAEGYFFEFLPDALLRGDQKSRYEAYAVARNWGFMSVNMVCDRENWNHVPNGDIFLQPLNMVEAGTKPPPVSAPSPAAAKYLLALAQTLVAADEERAKMIEQVPRPYTNGGSGAHDEQI